MPSQRVPASPSMAIAGAMLGAEGEEAVARHSLRGGRLSSAPQAREAPQRHRALTMKPVSMPAER